MGKTPIVFREPGVDPSLDEIPLRSVSMRPLLTCGAIGLIVLALACGGLMFVSAQMGSRATPTEPPPTLTSTPDEWAATGTAIAGWTATFTPTPTETPTETPTPTATLDAWDMTGTAVFWMTYTPTSTLTPSPTFTYTPRPTREGPRSVAEWYANVRASMEPTLQARRTEMAAWATVTAQAFAPAADAATPEPEVRYIEVTRIVNQPGQAPPPQIIYVTPPGYQPPAYQPPSVPTNWIVPLPTVNPTYYIWLTWTKTPTPPGMPTATASHTLAPATMTATASATASASPSATATMTATTAPPTATATMTATATATMTIAPSETPTDAPEPPPMATEPVAP